MTPQERARRAVDQIDFISRRNIEDAIVQAIRASLEEAAVELDLKARQTVVVGASTVLEDAATCVRFLKG